MVGLGSVVDNSPVVAVIKLFEVAAPDYLKVLELEMEGKHEVVCFRHSVEGQLVFVAVVLILLLFQLGIKLLQDKER